MALAALDERLLGLRDGAEGEGADDEQLGDALEEALAGGRLQELAQGLAAERDALQEALAAQATSYEARTREALERSLETLRRLERAETEAGALLERVGQEAERVRPISRQVDDSLTELAALANARAYAESMIVIKRLDAAKDPGEDEIAAACEALKGYRSFMAHLRQDDLNIAKEFSSSIARAVRARRAALQRAVKTALADLCWPVTASNPDLRVSEATSKAVQAAIAPLVRLQVLHLEQARTRFVAATGEFDHDLWAIAALARPILQRFAYHFSGSRSTNRIDKPDWYHQFILDAAKEHAGFLADVVQPAVEQCMPPETFVDAIVHFVRHLVVDGLHRHYEAIWPFVEQSNALICSTLDESIALTEQVNLLFGYQNRSSWPAPAAFFAQTESRFLAWMAADLEFGRRKLEGLLQADTAWNTVLDTIAQGSETVAPAAAAGQAGESSLLPECAGFVMTLIDSVGARADALEDASSRAVYLRMALLPLIEDFAVEIERRAVAVELHEEPTEAALTRWCRVLGAGVYAKQCLASWEDLPRFSDSAASQADLAGLATTMDSGLAEEILRDTAKGKTSALRGMMRGLLGRVRRPLHRGPAATRASGEDSGDALAEGIFAQQRARFDAIVESQLARFADIVVRRFGAAARGYFRSCREGGMNAGEVPAPHPGLADALAVISAALARTQPKLASSLHQRLVARVAHGVGASFQHELIDVCRFSAAGSAALDRDVGAVFAVFAPFANRPENRFFRALKDRVRVLVLPAHALKSLRQAIRSFANEPREVARLLEEGHGFATLTLNDVEFLAGIRTDF